MWVLGGVRPASATHSLTDGHCSEPLTRSLARSLSLVRCSFVTLLCLPTLGRQHILPPPSGIVMT